MPAMPSCSAGTFSSRTAAAQLEGHFLGGGGVDPGGDEERLAGADRARGVEAVDGDVAGGGALQGAVVERDAAGGGLGGDRGGVAAGPAAVGQEEQLARR